MTSRRSQLIGLALVLLIAGFLQGDSERPFATGAAILHVDGELRNFSFTAHADEDGVVRGMFQLHNRSQDVRLHGRIDCMNVSGNVATFSGVHFQATDETYLDQPFWFQVVDNGEGADAPPDQITLVVTFPGGGGPDCYQEYALELLDIEGGNIQVHE